MSPKKLGVCAMVLACQFALLGMPSRAQATTTVELLPTVVVGPPKSSEYPQPICSKCLAKAEREANTSGQSHGLLFIGYEDEVYGDFEGSIVVTVLLSNKERRVETIDDVVLSYGDEVTWTLADRAEYSWLDVDLVWIELVPAV